MIRQSKTTIKELSAQYRAVLRHAFLAGVICAVSMSYTGAHAAINVTTGEHDITNDVISTIVGNADMDAADGSYRPQTWDSASHSFVQGDLTDETYVEPGTTPSAGGVTLHLTHGVTTDLATYTGGYTITDPTLDPTEITVDATTYSYTKKAADGTQSSQSLTASDISDSPVLSTDGYDYGMATINAANGGSNYTATSRNVSDGAPEVTEYYYLDSNGDQVYFTPGTELNDLIGNAAAMDVFTNGYAADLDAYNTVNGYYEESNEAFVGAVTDVNTDQTTVNAAIEDYRNQIGVWTADNNTYSAYTSATEAAAAYDSSLAKIIDSKSADAEQNAKDYADGLAVNYDAAGAADTAEQNAKDYADTEIATEASAREGADSALQSAINGEASTRESADSALQSAITSEASARESADSALQSAITSEASAREGADSALQSAINGEASTRESADSALQSAITSEASAREGADSALQSAITSEASAREGADSALQSAITSEASAREGADSALQSAINSEANTRESMDNTLQSAINSEANTRESADSALQSAIDNETARAQAAEAAIRNDFAAGDAATLAKANAYTDKKVDTLEKNVSGGIAAATALSAVSVSNVSKGEVSVGGGYGYYNDQSAVALGATLGLSDRWSVNAGAGLATGDKAQFAIRAGTNYKFKLF